MGNKEQLETSKLDRLKAEVWAWCESIADSPNARYEARTRFYEQYGKGNSENPVGFGRSELDFMEWEMTGRLKAPDATPPGSTWWSEVNLYFVYLSELGARALQAGIDTDLLPLPSQNWVKFIQAPKPGHWYRAHNSSIIEGYFKYQDEAAEEPLTEQSFVNMVLYRLLFAQAMVEGASFAFPGLGKALANPKGFAVDLIVHLHDMYPEVYPITNAQYKDFFESVHSIEDFLNEFMDDVIVGAEIVKLYDMAAEWNGQPKLPELLKGRIPAYPNGVPMMMDKPNWFILLLRKIWKWWNRIMKKK